MIELSRHIELLLLENDCVVVPDLGGFIAHYQPARYVEDEGIFLPPLRTVGFNPQLTMNDGLLTQSYMQTYHTDFPDAARKIATKVEEFKECLYKEGMVTMHGVGELYYNIRGEYEFHPESKGILSPSLYGLDTFMMPLLADLEVAEEKTISSEVTKPQITEPVLKKKEIRLNPSWMGRAVAVAVAAVLFFILSVPVENTYIDQGNYASLGTDCLFEAIRSQSMATMPAEVAVTDDVAKDSEQKHLKPVAVKVEKVLPSTDKKPSQESNVISTPVEKPKEKMKDAEKKPAKETPKASIRSSKKYCIIVASLPTSSDAQRMIQSYHKKGYTDASVVEGSGRYRIALYTYSDKATAYQKLNSLKQEEAFKSAWMLSTK
ncbi:MAG: SPOR domain-containing protein [Bacteroides sp.]|nr:SPOR domain-containing protein [Bacteroides sp.]